MAKGEFSKELAALAKILEALSPLDDQQRTFVLDTVAARLGLSNAPVRQKSSDSDQADSSKERINSGKDMAQLSPKEFLAQKKPANAVEHLICLAYYLSKHRDISAFKTIEITKLNTEAAGHKLSNASVFARNAVSQNGYLVPAGGGKKQLTLRGEAVVEALPDREKVKAAIEENFFKGRKKKKVGTSGSAKNKK